MATNPFLALNGASSADQERHRFALVEIMFEQLLRARGAGEISDSMAVDLYRRAVAVAALMVKSDGNESL